LTDHFDDDLCLKEVDVFGEVESILAAVSDHVSVENIVGAFKHSNQVRQINGDLQWKLQQTNEQINHLLQNFIVNTTNSK